MAYLLPSFLQKRILRYALSRLELLDTNDFDLDNLDIAWGKRSTVELRNISIHIKKLSTLLQLPCSFTLVKARIPLLRITVPADLYKSGILVEADGLQIGVEVSGTEDDKGEQTKSPNRGTPRGGLQKGVKADRPRDTQFHIHDPGGFERLNNGEKLSEHLPTTIDLAKSFVQTEPKGERVELQNAIAQSQHLSHSETLSEISEDGTGFGVGGGISLPGFVADFLTGVGDRIQLSIKNADIDLTMELELPSGDSAPNVLQKSEVVTLKLSVQEVELQGVTTNSSVIDPYSLPADAQIKENRKRFATKGGFRRISLRNIQGMLISETSLFSNLSRFSVPPSPNLTHTSSSRKPNNVTPISTSRSDSPFSIATLGTNRSAILTDKDANRVHVSQPPSASEIEEPNYDPDFEAANTEGKSSDEDPDLSESQYEDSVLAGSSYSSEGDGQFGGQQYVSQKNIPGSFGNFHISSLLQEASEETDAVSRSQRSEKIEETNQMELNTSVSPEHNLQSGRTSPQLESLAQSRFFSHEEAESMYMSAMSQAPSQNEITQQPMPGDWGDSDSEDGQSRLTPAVHGRDVTYGRRQNDQNNSLGLGLETQSLDMQRNAALKLSGEQAPNEHATSMPRTAQSSNQAPAKPDTYSTPAVEQSSLTASNASSENGLVVVKNILTVDSIVLEIPKSSDGEVVDLASSAQPIQHSRSSPAREEPLKASGRSSTLGHEEPTLGSTSLKPHPWMTMEVGNVSVLGDISLTKLTILIAQRLTVLLRSEPLKNTARTEKERSPNRTAIRVERVSWKFLDLVKGVGISGPEMLSPTLRAADSLENTDVLLKASIIKLKILIENDGQSSTSTVSMSKLNFGYALENILSFDSGLKMRDSNRDILAPVDQDLVLKVTQSPGRRQIELTTLPLHVRFDLRRLDETFSWFGGFSSILGLGSSMISTVTVVDSKSRIRRPTKPARGVHFENDRHHDRLIEPPNLSQQKVTVRLGGIVFDLQGTSSSFRFESTAIKVVSRAEGVGLAVDRLNVTGPSIVSKTDKASISANLAGLRVEYLPVPKDVDLARLLALLSPSKDRYKEQDDDILLETLFRQRRQGGVLRVTVETLDSRVLEIEDLKHLPTLGDEMKKLSTVAKYLPEDDRPGIMMLLLIRELQLQTTLTDSFGQLSLAAKHTEVAHVTLPSLVALGVGKLKIERNFSEELVGEAVATLSGQESPPTIMARFIGNEMEPTVKIKLYNLRTEYHVSTIAAIMSIQDDLVEGRTADMVSSISTITDKQRTKESPPTLSAQSSDKSDNSTGSSKSLKIDIALHDVNIGLNPRNSTARGLLVLTDTLFVYTLPKDDEASAVLEINKASLMAIDDIHTEIASKHETERMSSNGQDSQLQQLSNMGYVSLSYISAARTTFDVTKSASETGKTVEIELRDMLLVIESCADSTETLQTIVNGLQPPQPPSTELKYRTEVVPIEDMLASFSGNAFATPEQGDDGVPLELDEGDMVEDDVPQNLEFVSSFYNPTPETMGASIADSMLEEDLDSLASPPVTRSIGDKTLLDSFQEQYQVASDESTLNFNEDYFGSSSTVGGTAHRWDIKKNTYELTNEPKIHASPLKLRVREIHIIWNLFDGYDWQHTRDTISQAVAAVEDKAMEQRSRKDRHRSVEVEEEEDSVIGDFLFNSIYIGIPANRDPKELSRQVSRNIDDLVSENESYTASTASDSPSRQSRAPRPKGKKPRLRRSKYHKMTFELKGVSADVVVFPPNSGETQSSIDIRVHDFEIFDHVPTSTWKKFATYMHDAGERESGTSMFHLEILNVKPVPNLAASEIILKVEIHLFFR